MLTLLLSSCDKDTSPGASAPSDDATKPASGVPRDGAPAPDASAPSAPPAEAEAELEQGWVRVDLSTLSDELTGTLVAPFDKTATFDAHEDTDRDGLTTRGLGARLGPTSGGATLRAPAIIAPRLASPEAMLAFHKQFEHVSTHPFGEGHWAVVQRWRPGECMLHGWSEAAGLTCDVFKAPCDAMDDWVKTCGSLTAGPKPNASVATPASAFRKLKPAAAAVAVRVARAVARNDSALLLSTLGPGGLKVGKRTYDRKSFEPARGEKTIAQFVAPSLEPAEAEPGVSLYQWNTDVPPEGEATVFFTAGYGEVPVFKLEEADGAWHLTGFDVVDLGDP